MAFPGLELNLPNIEDEEGVGDEERSRSRDYGQGVVAYNMAAGDSSGDEAVGLSGGDNDFSDMLRGDTETFLRDGLLRAEEQTRVLQGELALHAEEMGAMKEERLRHISHSEMVAGIYSDANRQLETKVQLQNAELHAQHGELVAQRERAREVVGAMLQEGRQEVLATRQHAGQNERNLQAEREWTQRRVNSLVSEGRSLYVQLHRAEAVSYTHLTLPTRGLV